MSSRASFISDNSQPPLKLALHVTELPTFADEHELLGCFSISHDLRLLQQLLGCFSICIGVEGVGVALHRSARNCEWTSAAHSDVRSTARRLATVCGISIGVDEVGAARH